MVSKNNGKFHAVSKLPNLNLMYNYGQLNDKVACRIEVIKKNNCSLFKIILLHTL